MRISATCCGLCTKHVFLTINVVIHAIWSNRCYYPVSRITTSFNQSFVYPCQWSHSGMIPKWATLSQSTFATGWLTENGTTAPTQHNSLCMWKHCCDIETARTFNILQQLVVASARHTMKNEFGVWTSFLSLCLLASEAGLGFKRSWARTWRH
jgi:hypothetical protein